MARRWNDGPHLLALSGALLFVLLAIGSSKGWFDSISTLNQGADFFSDGKVKSPPTSGYCHIKSDERLLYFFQSFQRLADKNIIAFVSNTEWNSPYGVDRGSLLLRDFSYSWFIDENGIKKYQYNATGQASTYVAGCYCKYVVVGTWPYSYDRLSTKRYTETPAIRRPSGYTGKTSNLECCSGIDDKRVAHGQMYDKTDPKKMCCPSGKVVDKCTDTGACPNSASSTPGTTFETTRQSDNCCPANRLSATTIAFLKKIEGYCHVTVSSTMSGCHTFESDHYGGCAVDIKGANKACLKKAGYTISSSYLPGTCTLDGSFYHCTLCNSDGPGSSGYDKDQGGGSY